MDIDDYQHEALQTDQSKRSTVSLYGLAGELGGLFSLFKKRIRDRPAVERFKVQLTEELGDMLWYLSSLASHHKIKLSDIARMNLSKSKALFDEGLPTEFDRDFPTHEQLPRHMKLEFRLDKVGKSEVMYEGSRLGDPLSDNADSEDYYRFHDIFHFSFMTFLGWSPVTRRNLKRKRKSKPEVDQNLDGARAVIVEETIAAVIFSVAEQNEFFPDPHGIPTSLIRTVMTLASKFEVKICTAEQWKQAIWHACQIYRELVKNEGGIVELDQDDRRIEYTAA